MSALRKLVLPFILSATLISLLPLQLASSTQDVKQNGGSPTRTKDDGYEHLSSKLKFEITLHGFLLWASMGFLMPLGILVIRMSNREECRRRLKYIFYAHVILQILSLLLSTAGAVLSFKNFNNTFNNYHQRIGVALYGLIWLQALSGFLRPQTGRKTRSVWFLAHWLLGTAVSLLGIFNVYLGLRAYRERRAGGRLWSIFFTAEICLFGFLYLLQGKWDYIQNQGATLPNDLARPTAQVPSQADNRKAANDC